MTRAARAVFVALVGATFGAFFVAQALKASPAVLDVKRFTEFFSPNGDGRRDVEAMSFTIRRTDDVTVSIVDRDGDEVRRLADGVHLRSYALERVSWDGRTDDGARAPDGIYRLRIGLIHQGRSATYTKPIVLDTSPPRPSVRLGHHTDPHVIGPFAAPVALRLGGVSRRTPTQLRVWRTDLPTPAVVRDLVVAPAVRRTVWDGKVADGSLAPPGTYLFEAITQDRAGNAGSSAPGLPGRPSAIRGTGGITVRSIGIVPPGRTPFGPVHAGTRMTVLVDARRKPYTWTIRRLGAPRPRARGRGTGPALKLTAPSGRSGVYVLTVRARRFHTSVPFAVQSDDTASVLVVLPALSWIGADRVDDNGDGWPDTLTDGGPALLARVFSGDRGMPAGFARDVAPLLVLFDRARIPYDVTTDLALLRGGGPAADANPGVLLAGPFGWIPRRVAQRLRAYAEGGGRVASFGAVSLRRSVTVARGSLVRPTVTTPIDPFGAHLDAVRTLPAPTGMDTFLGANALGLLVGTDGHLDGFSAFEESEPPADPRSLVVSVGVPVPQSVIASADAQGTVPPDPKPSLTATRLGKGLVIRVGLPEWAQRIRRDGEVAQITHNVIDILRGVAPKLRAPLR